VNPVNQELAAWTPVAVPPDAELTVCWARGESAARRTVRELWPTAAMESSLSWELPLPAHFEAVAELVAGDAVAGSVVCGPDQAGFVRFYQRELLPRVRAVLTG
jgi:hypothetical protein